MLSSFQLLAQESNPMYAILKEGKWTFYDTQNKEMFQTSEPIIEVNAFEHGLSLVSLGPTREYLRDKRAVLNEKGQFLPLNFPDSLTVISIDLIDKQFFFWLTKVHGYIYSSAVLNKKGKMIPSKPYYLFLHLGENIAGGYEQKSIDEFSINATHNFEIWNIKTARKLFTLAAEQLGRYNEGLLPFKRNGKWGFVNKRGKVVIEPTFTKIGAYEIAEFGFIKHYFSETQYINNFQSGALAAANEDGKFGLIDKNGNWLLSPQYDEVMFARENFWTLKTKMGKWVLANHLGKLIPNIEAEDPITVFNNIFIHSIQLPESPIDRIYGIMNTEGNWVFRSDSIFNRMPIMMGDGFFMHRNNQFEQVFCNNEGKILRTFKLDTFYMPDHFSFGLASVRCKDSLGNTSLGYISKQGTWSIPPGKIIPEEIKIEDMLPVASDKFILIADSKGYSFYNHNGNLIHFIKKNSDEYEWLVILQLQKEEWPRN